jgi:hypothetical protein
LAKSEVESPSKVQQPNFRPAPSVQEYVSVSQFRELEQRVGNLEEAINKIKKLIPNYK